MVQPGSKAIASGATTAGEADAGVASPRATRAALYMALAHCQGGHSDAGKVGAEVLGVRRPFNMRSLIKAARAEGFNPAALYPWLMSAAYSGGRYFTGFEKSDALRVRVDATQASEGSESSTRQVEQSNGLDQDSSETPSP